MEEEEVTKNVLQEERDLRKRLYAIFIKEEEEWRLIEWSIFIERGRYEHLFLSQTN
jgi:hypothetical protein